MLFVEQSGNKEVVNNITKTVDVGQNVELHTHKLLLMFTFVVVSRQKKLQRTSKLDYWLKS